MSPQVFTSGNLSNTASGHHAAHRLSRVVASRIGVRVRLWADRDGASAVEFALLVPALVILVIGTVDMGQLAYQYMQVSAAAHAGAQYALRNGWNASAITTAVTGSTPLTVTATPAPQQITACVTGGAVVATTQTTCSGGGTPGTYVQVNVQAAITPLITWSAFNLPTSLSSQAMVRIK